MKAPKKQYKQSRREAPLKNSSIRGAKRRKTFFGAPIRVVLNDFFVLRGGGGGLTPKVPKRM